MVRVDWLAFCWHLRRSTSPARPLDPFPGTGLRDIADRTSAAMTDEHLSPAQTAKRLGVSAKALRLYERH